MYFKAVALLSLVASSVALPTTTSNRPVKEPCSRYKTIPSSRSPTAWVVMLSPKLHRSSRYGPQSIDTCHSNPSNSVSPAQIDESNLANLDPEDLEIIKAAGNTAEQAEVGDGGFNEAIDTAGGKNTAAGKALQVGKIKNKVLKLQLSVLSLGAEVAQGRQDRAAKLQEQKTKLANNVQLDKDAAGQKSTPVNFQGDSQP
jgi:hypothetical protein